jgi:uncharacterized damage-inducible protein DinB
MRALAQTDPSQFLHDYPSVFNRLKAHLWHMYDIVLTKGEKQQGCQF